ncbi:MAG: hypothetical protein HOE11_02365 [Candidatus Diapherotrites archaeon]|nr:hypothetical protein [Candidatus Diapherotrites archaeon]MBT4596973.1 hypothetical protein [Candidatus Diapherotrites archaeon]
MKEWFETKFGDAPYKEVRIVKFSFEADSHEDTAFKQYTLLLDAGVIQGHLEFSTKKGILIFETNANPKEILSKELTSVTIDSEETIAYEKVMESNNMFV